MKIRRFEYMEIDEDSQVTREFFKSVEDARSHAKGRLQLAIGSIFDDYQIPEKDIDADGNYTHFGLSTEILSSDWGWYVDDGISRSRKGDIAEIEIEISPEELTD